MASKYQFAIIDRDSGRVVVATEPRDSGTIVTEFCARLANKGVGIFHTTSQVQKAAQETLEELITELKARVRPYEA